MPTASLPYPEDRLRQRPGDFATYFFLATAAWAVLSCLALWAAAHGSLQTARADFERRAEAAYAVLHDRLRDNEAALFSFASLLSAVAPDDLEAPRMLADSLMRQYPHLHNLQVVRQVSAAELPAFLTRARSLLGMDFRLTAFASESDAGGGPVSIRDVHFPIVAGYPAGKESAAYAGRDLGTIPFLDKPLLDAAARSRHFVSPVFPAPDGDGLMLAMFRAAPRPASQMASGFLGGTLYAVLVVPVASLEPDAGVREAGVAYRLRHTGYPETVFGDMVFDLPGNTASVVERWLLPMFSLEREFADIDQPFNFVARRQTVAGDLATAGVFGALLLSLLSCGGLYAYYRNHRRQQTRIRQQEEQIRHLALHDQLTGLPNRRLLEDRLQRALELARRQGERVGVLFLDIDEFRQIGNHYGTEAGDALLREVGVRLARCVRESDTVARYGSDEFVLICGGLQHGSDAVAVAEKVRQALAEPFTLGRETLRVTCGIGVSIYPDSSEVPETLVAQADVAMYRAKGLGRGRVQIFRVEMASVLN